MIYGKVTTFYTIYDIFVRLKYVIYLQLIILRLRNCFSYFENTQYIITLKTHITSFPLEICCLIELIRILVTYWVVSSPFFSPSNFRLWRIYSESWEFWWCVVSRKKKLSDFGIGWSSNCFIFIGQLALCTWGLDFVPIKLLEIYFIKKLLRYFGFIWFNFWG